MKRLREWLRNWLGIKAESDAHASEYRTLRREMDEYEKRIDKKLGELAELIGSFAETAQENLAETAQNLQTQITDLQSPDGPLAKPKPKAKDEDQNMVMPGHTRFSQRKREWERKHALPLKTETTKQIEENTRLIASGTRKTE
jgi:hypothetical protein